MKGEENKGRNHEFKKNKCRRQGTHGSRDSRMEKTKQGNKSKTPSDLVGILRKGLFGKKPGVLNPQGPKSPGHAGKEKHGLGEPDDSRT